jgi:acetyl esterase/lipase
MQFTRSFIQNKRIFFLLFFITCWVSFSHAQCPQRYLDRVFDKVKKQADIKYGIEKLNTDGTRTWQAFDFYEPKEDTAQLRPLIVLIHGGGFTNWPPIDRNSPDIIELGNDLAKRGYTVISPEYRLYSGEATYNKMAETVFAAAFDINELMCYLAGSVASGNPLRIDTSRFFIGGSSAGALLALDFGVLVNDTAQLSAELRERMNVVATLDNVNPQELLQHKFCGIKPKGTICISGAVVDTNMIQPNNEKILIIHGTNDGAIPYMIGHPLKNPVLPMLYGPGVFMDKMIRAGMYVEADIYPGKYHVPVLHPFGDSLLYALQLVLQTGSLFDKVILDSTERHIATFCYNIIGKPTTNCFITKVKQNIISDQLSIYPNPSNGKFIIEIPALIRNKKLTLEVFDITGRMTHHTIVENSANYSLDISQEANGIYWIRLSNTEQEDSTIYINKIVVQ